MESPVYTEEELRNMLIASHVSRFRKLKRRMIMEVLFSVLLLPASAVIFSFFSNQAWLFTVATGSIALLVFNRYVEHFYLRFIPSNPDWHLLLKQVSEPIKKVLNGAHFANVAISITLLVILTLRAREGSDSVYLWAFLVPVAFGIAHLAPGFWLRRMVDIETILDEYTEEHNRKKPKTT